MSRRSYINRMNTYYGPQYACHWCDRSSVDVLQTSPPGGPMGARYECVNQRQCMKERTIKAGAARIVRELEQARAAELEQAGAHACITASCLTHRAPVFWQSSERRWLHTAGCFPCERDIFTAAPRPARRPAELELSPAGQLDLYGADAGQIFGQVPLFGGAA